MRNELFTKRVKLRKRLYKKSPSKLYAYIYRAHITKKQILDEMKQTMSKKAFDALKNIPLMNLCSSEHFSCEIVEAIVDIKLPYRRTMVLC